MRFLVDARGSLVADPEIGVHSDQTTMRSQAIARS